MTPSAAALWPKALLCAIACVVLGGAGGLVTASSIPGWYSDLEKPPGTPPNWLFGPVWTLLYATMGVAFARVWHLAPAGGEKRRALGLFLLQFVLNLVWTPLFFGAHLLGAALVEILLLAAAIVLTARAFLRLDRAAGWMLAPYLAWVAYASYLSGGFWLLNR